MSIQPGQGRRPAGPGFTLVELLLTVALLLLMVGAGVLNFGSLQRGAQLDEGATQVESLFRFARAQAASTGRTVRIVFSDDPPAAGTTNAPVPASLATTGPQVSWETDPLGAPGQFAALREAAPFAAQLGDLVEVREVRFPGSAAEAAVATATTTTTTLAAAGAEAKPALEGQPLSATPPILFYPDGSSDSVEVVLASLDREDRRRLAVKLVGLTGALSRRQLETGGSEAQLEEAVR